MISQAPVTAAERTMVWIRITWGQRGDLDVSRLFQSARPSTGAAQEFLPREHDSIRLVIVINIQDVTGRIYMALLGITWLHPGWTPPNLFSYCSWSLCKFLEFLPWMNLLVSFSPLGIRFAYSEGHRSNCLVYSRRGVNRRLCGPFGGRNVGPVGPDDATPIGPILGGD
jgi:hypothetical protein